jgi:hypothetical protein
VKEKKQEEELNKQEQSYHQLLLELAIEDPEIGNFVEENLEVDKMSVEELTALFASGDFGFNFSDDAVASSVDHNENLGDTEPERDPANAEVNQGQGTTSTTTKKKTKTLESGSSKSKKSEGC